MPKHKTRRPVHDAPREYLNLRIQFPLLHPATVGTLGLSQFDNTMSRSWAGRLVALENLRRW